MALADLTKKIIEDAEAESVRIIKNGEEKAAGILARAKEKRSALQKEYAQKLDHTLKDNESRVASSAEKDARRLIDEAKRALIEEVFDGIFENLVSLPDDEYEKILLPYIKSLPKDTHGTITAPENRIEITKKIFKNSQIDAEIKTSGSFLGGCIVSSPKHEYDFTFENILRGHRQDLEPEIARILFEND